MTPQDAIGYLLDPPFELEGRAYSIDPVPTYAGITQAESITAGVNDPRDLSQAQIDTFYTRDYWDAMKCGEMPDGIDFALFQAGVNAGTVTAVRWMQAILGVGADGKVGPQTLGALRRMNKDTFLKQFLQAQDEYYDRITYTDTTRSAFTVHMLADGSTYTNEANIDGWHNRVNKVRAIVLRDYTGLVLGIWPVLVGFGLLAIVLFLYKRFGHG